MEHVVFFPHADGTTAFRRVASLDDAVVLVEHLRNVEQVDGVTVHALTEVPLAFRAYYKVEVATAQPESVEVPEAAEVAAPVADADLPPLVTVDETGPHARNGADVRELGFFAS
ncbi:MAG: hypothetical protein JWN17_2496 [Frankiales bacterium]|nr:hypothetical protein [Frankiales bacterium]